VDTEQVAGAHRVTFDAAGLSSGVYLYRMDARKFADARRCIVLK
jgi:hypothetical protein